MKNTKRALLLSILSLLLCVAMLLGTTFAWFTDSVTSGTNKIVAGNLDIDVLHTNAKITTEETIQDKTNLFTDKDGKAMLWEPGAMSYENFTVKNLGTLALKYNLAMNITDYNALNGHSLKEVLKVKVLTGTDIISTVTREAVAALDWNTTDTLDVFNTSGELKAQNDADNFQVIVYWEPTDNDNLWNVNNGQSTTDGQPLFVDFGINVIASQLNYESDSFDKNYDRDIILPDLPVSINKTFQSAPITTSTVSESVTVKNVSTDSGVATMQKNSVNAVISKLLEKATDKATDSDISTVIYLNVTTVDKAVDSVTYNIDLSAVMTYTDTNGVQKTQTLDNSTNAKELDAVLKNAGKTVRAVMNIGKGLSNVTVKHNDVAMNALSSKSSSLEGFYYDKSAGELIINSKSFSPFTIEYTLDAVAMIKNTVYATLDDALAAAVDGDTVVLLKDITAKKCIQIINNKNISINLNGKTVECTDNTEAVLLVNDDATLSMIYGGTLKGTKLVYINGTNAHLGEIKDCELITTNRYYPAVSINGKCDKITNVKLSGICATAVDVMSKHSGTTVINGLECTATICNGDDYWFSMNKGTVEIKKATVSEGKFGVEPTAALTITGGTYGTDPSAYVDKNNYTVTESDGKWTVTSKYAAKVGEEKFDTLIGALNSVSGKTSTTQTVTLLKDCEGDGINMPKSKYNVIIDFDGYTYTIKASVGSEGTKSQALHIEKRNTVILKNGTIIADSMDVKTMINDYAGYQGGAGEGTYFKLDNMVLDATKGNNQIGDGRAVLTSPNGTTYICNNTRIIAKEGEAAIEVEYWKQYYADGSSVRIEDNTVVLQGSILYTNGSDDSEEIFLTKATLEVPSDNTTISAPNGYTWIESISGYKKLTASK